jgi:hypothetical protein
VVFLDHVLSPINKKVKESRQLNVAKNST